MAYFLLVIIGLVSGAIKGLTSSSGVMIVVSLLNMFFKSSVHSAIGTSLMVDSISSFAISTVFYRYRNLDIGSGIWIAFGSILGAQIGALFAVKIPEIPLGIIFAVLMLFFGFLLFKKGIKREEIVKKFRGFLKFRTSSERIFTAVFFGFLVGIISGILGAGGGIMVLLILVFVLNFPLGKALGTSIFIMAITSFSGTIAYGYHQELNFFKGTLISLGAVSSGISGALFANKISEEKLNKVVGLIFFILGLAMLSFLLYEALLSFDMFSYRVYTQRTFF